MPIRSAALALAALLSLTATVGAQTATTGQAGQAGQQGQQGQQGGQTGVGGIFVDAQGVVAPAFARDKKLDEKRRLEVANKALPGDVNVFSPLRKVSLVQLEKACEQYAAKKLDVPSEMSYLAGLQRVDYVFVYPETKDIVIAGPAEGFVIDSVTRATGITTKRPPLRLDDLIVALRVMERGGELGCSIDPVRENLSRMTAYLNNNSSPATTDVAKSRFNEMQRILGLQDVRVFGVPADSHFANMLVEADYRMKLLSIGLEQPPVKGLRSHLSMIPAGQNAMQRFWFTPLYDGFVKSGDGLAYQFKGPRAQLLAQEEMVSVTGQRSQAAFTKISTNRFAKLFTEKFPELADAEPIFAELQTGIDLAVLAALFKKERIAESVGWDKALFLDTERCKIAQYNVPRKVMSAMNYKSSGSKLLIGLIGGGVTIDAFRAINSREYLLDDDNVVQKLHAKAKPEKLPEQHLWWWD